MSSPEKMKMALDGAKITLKKVVEEKAAKEAAATKPLLPARMAQRFWLPTRFG
jgi:hypothetical protein